MKIKKKNKKNMSKKQPFFHSFSLTLGLFLVVVGLFMFARQLGWVSEDFPFWPVILIAFGIFITAGELSKS